MSRARETVLGHTMAWVLFAHAALAGTVTVEVKNQSGTGAENAVIVFDPQDAAAPARDTAIIDQVNKTFVPHVSVIRTGTAVLFPNSDRIRHQVYSFSPAKTFTLKLYAGSPRVEVVFDKAGLVVLGCNIHDTMVAFVAVVDSPYFAKIPPSGNVTLNLPPGRYRLRVWHPGLKAAIPPQQVEVAVAPMDIPLTLDIDASRDDPAAWTE